LSWAGEATNDDWPTGGVETAGLIVFNLSRAERRTVRLLTLFYGSSVLEVESRLADFRVLIPESRTNNSHEAG
jgi:hypothetical protein